MNSFWRHILFLTLITLTLFLSFAFAMLSTKDTEIQYYNQEITNKISTLAQEDEGCPEGEELIKKGNSDKTISAEAMALKNKIRDPWRKSDIPFINLIGLIVLFASYIVFAFTFFTCASCRVENKEECFKRRVLIIYIATFVCAFTLVGSIWYLTVITKFLGNKSDIKKSCLDIKFLVISDKCPNKGDDDCEEDYYYFTLNKYFDEMKVALAFLILSLIFYAIAAGLAIYIVVITFVKTSKEVEASEGKNENITELAPQEKMPIPVDDPNTLND